MPLSTIETLVVLAASVSGAAAATYVLIAGRTERWIEQEAPRRIREHIDQLIDEAKRPRQADAARDRSQSPRVTAERREALPYDLLVVDGPVTDPDRIVFHVYEPASSPRPEVVGFRRAIEEGRASVAVHAVPDVEQDLDEATERSVQAADPPFGRAVGKTGSRLGPLSDTRASDRGAIEAAQTDSIEEPILQPLTALDAQAAAHPSKEDGDRPVEELAGDGFEEMDPLELLDAGSSSSSGLPGTYDPPVPP